MRMLLLTALLSISCAASPPAASEAPEPAPACSDFDQVSCIDSTACTLVATEESNSPYTCRAAEPPCETDFRQRGDGAEACQAKAGCRYVPERCYCPPDVTCICGGGPPAQCIAEDGSERGSSDS